MPQSGNKKQERNFEREIKKIEQLEESAKLIHKDARKCIDCQSARSKAEGKVVQNLKNSDLLKEDRKDTEKLRAVVDNWSLAAKKLELLSEELNATTQKVILEPTKRFSVVFPAIQQSVKKRDQCLQEYVKCMEKKDKYSARERTGPNVVKLENSRKALANSKSEFDAQCNLLLEELPHLYDSRIDYFQPSLQAFVSAEMKYYADCHRTYSDLCTQIDGSQTVTTDTLNKSIQQKLAEIRTLSITTTDDQL